MAVLHICAMLNVACCNFKQKKVRDSKPSEMNAHLCEQKTGQLTAFASNCEMMDSSGCFIVAANAVGILNDLRTLPKV